MRISYWSSDVCSSDLLSTAYAIREGLYRRTASLIGYDGALSGMHPTGRALEQLRAHFQAKPSIYRSNLKKVSRRFGALSVHDQESVIRELPTQGVATLEGALAVRSEARSGGEECVDKV